MPKASFLILIFICCCLLTIAQPAATASFKTLNVTDGLPQSFISGLIQDSTGFIWIGTRDGLARYDGRKFKVFRHVPGDTTTLFGNIITNLYLDKQQWLWVVYESGDIDVLNTTTEALLHINKNTIYRPAYSVIKTGNFLAEDKKGNVSMLCAGGGFVVCNKDKQTMHFYADSVVGLPKGAISSLAEDRGNIVMITADVFITVSDNFRIIRVDSLGITHNKVNDPAGKKNESDTAAVIKNDIIIQYRNNLALYNPRLRSVRYVPLPKANNPSIVCSTTDEKGNFIFYYDSTFYVLSDGYKLHSQKPKKEGSLFGPKSILVDRSGVLWLGGNGAGIKLYDLRLSHWLALPYKKTFHEDVLQNDLGVPAVEMKKSFLYDMSPYCLRWAKDKNGKTWFSMAGSRHNKKPNLCYYKDNHLFLLPWHYSDTGTASHININAVAFSKTGKLWGMDYYLRPVSFDTLTYAVTVYTPVATANFSQEYTVNSLVIDNEDTFWFSTVLDGLYCYNIKTGKSTHYTETSGAVPTNQLLNMIQDPIHANILWIGSMGGGLIRFNKLTGKSRVFTTRDGLPNNTVYTALNDAKGMLWCSTNKGIFSFNPNTNFVRSFISKDGLPGDEFNRYHFLQLPDGRIAFGGVDGYAVFDPLSIANDNFQPNVALTAYGINNTRADFGFSGSPFKKSINSINEIVLPYNKNFLSFEFAGLEYNITEKLQYRYMLEGFNDNWVNTGNENVATYTNIPPGHYVLKINATNTAGIWSSHIKTLSVIIQPPFWKTWWFVSLCILATAALIYFIIKNRIAGVRKEEQQKAEFEREASELKAQALRAQMNPHFIFNCLNSIKALIQEDNKQQAVIYLTTFSKLIRNQLNNAQQEVSLYDELETCRLYTQLEALRFGSKIACEFRIEENLDIRSIQVPPLIVQPFIENAIWHGILPKGGGQVQVLVSAQDGCIECAIEDNGIGRDTSLRNKSHTSATYQSKGMKLVQGRLNLHNIITNQGGTIELIDKKDNDGNGSGTLVILKFKKEV